MEERNIYVLWLGECVFLDRYFTTVGLMDKLLSLNLEGTITFNRFKGYEFKADKDMKRGENEEVVRSDKKLCLIKWKDNKSVIMLWTTFGSRNGIKRRRKK